jgi:hypothetical protein
MNLIHDVDKPGSDIEYYVNNLDKILADKAEKINGLRNRLKKFHIMLKDEETLSAKFANSNDVLDIYDLNKNKNFENLINSDDGIDDEKM